MIGKRRPVHPGEVLLEDIIKPLGLTVTEAALRLGVTRKTLSALLNGKASLSPEMATRIALATGTSSESWLYMQAKLDLWNVAKHPPKVHELKASAF
ncbi:MAG: HigA family addiction module antidote protein [Nitrospirae bacterium]|nr:HigA family addiction module antidote protein [Nitrospirota bacterium]